MMHGPINIKNMEKYFHCFIRFQRVELNWAQIERVDVIIHREVTINSTNEIIPIGTLISQKSADFIAFAAVALNHEWKLVNTEYGQSAVF